MLIDQKTQQQLREQYNPEGSDMRKVQLLLLDILVEFDRVCRKNGIDYWIEYGTLIGAARHGGFVPWDDDLDVSILNKDRKKLVKAMKKDLSAPFTFIDADSKEGRSRRWARILYNKVTITRLVEDPKGNMIPRKENIWLDLFYLINGTKPLSRKVDGFYGRCYRRKKKLVQDGWFNYTVGVVAFPFVQLLTLCIRGFSRIFHSKTVINIYGTTFHSQRNLKDIFPTQDIEFEGHLFRAPHNIDGYLSGIYGKWQELPQVKENHCFEDITVS